MQTDIHSNLEVAVAIGAAALAADTTPAAIDLQGFSAAEIVLAIGAGGIVFDTTNKIEFVLTHSTDGVTYDNVADGDVLGVTGTSSGIIKSLVAAHAAAAAYRFGYRGGRRYLKLKADFSGTHGTATPIAATVVKGKPSAGPTANQA